MRCESCGAELPQGQSTCEYCGSTWDRVIPATAVASCVDESIFARIKQTAAWTDRGLPHRQANLPKLPALATVAPIAFLAMFIAISAFMAITILAMAGVFGAVGFSHGGAMGGGLALIPALMALMPFGFVLLGVVMLRKHRQTLIDFRSSPTMTLAAVIAGKRIQVCGGGRNTSTSTRYFITAQFEDGRRQEFSVITPGDFYGQISEGDCGVLFVRGKYALDFDRVVL